MRRLMVTRKQLAPRKDDNREKRDGTDSEHETVSLDKAAFIF